MFLEFLHYHTPDHNNVAHTTLHFCELYIYNILNFIACGSY